MPKEAYFLSQIVSTDSTSDFSANPTKTSLVANLPVPEANKKVQKFLSLANCDQIWTKYAHNDKAKFSLPIDSFINNLMQHHCATTTNKTGLLLLDYFLRCGLEMAMVALNKQALSRKP